MHVYNHTLYIYSRYYKYAYILSNVLILFFILKYVYISCDLLHFKQNFLHELSIFIMHSKLCILLSTGKFLNASTEHCKTNPA